VVSTGADPVGATFDNNPVNGPVVETDQRLYTGATYAAGFRQERIAALLEASGIVSEATMTRIQHDTRSNAGAALRDALVTALDRTLKMSGLPAGDFARLLTARDLLSDWTFATPTSSDPAPALTDSSATALFNAWMGEFLKLALCDELVNQTPVPQACALDRYTSDHLVRIVHAILVTPTKLTSELGEPIMCDDFDSATTDSCATMAARAMLQAMTLLESLTGGDQPADWRWGDLHQLVIEPLFPAADLTLPGPGELATTGFPRAGDQFAVNSADHGYTGTFSQQAGPAYRFLAIANPGERIELRLQLPGGAIFDPRDPHYRDLLDRYYLKETHFVAPFSVQQIIDNGEHRWDFR
jgi:acyl-homoserine lactone acylase PvdQ